MNAERKSKWKNYVKEIKNVKVEREENILKEL